MSKLPLAIADFRDAARLFTPHLKIKMAMVNEDDVRRMTDATRVLDENEILSVDTIMGIRVITSKKVPPGEVWFVNEYLMMRIDKITGVA